MNRAVQGFRILVVAILAPLAIAIVAIIVELVLAAHAPALVATHWGSGDFADGYGSPYTYPILMGSISGALIALVGGSVVVATHRAPVTRVLKLLGVTSLWVTLLLAITLTWALVVQQTETAVHHVGGLGYVILGSFGVALLVAAGAWFVLPKAASWPVSSDGVRVAPVQLATGERASWIRTTAASRGVLFGFIGIGVLLGAAEILIVVLTNGRLWWFSIVPVIAILVLLPNLAWTVRVDARGIRMHSALGLPVISIPLTNIASANLVDVNAFSQYGGWGIRWNLSGRFGIILRSGQALEIHRKKGIVIVITIDDAATAAALINGLEQQKARIV